MNYTLLNVSDDAPVAYKQTGEMKDGEMAILVDNGLSCDGHLLLYTNDAEGTEMWISLNEPRGWVWSCDPEKNVRSLKKGETFQIVGEG